MEIHMGSLDLGSLLGDGGSLGSASSDGSLSDLVSGGSTGGGDIVDTIADAIGDAVAEMVKSVLGQMS
jgi:hypothetical protein